MSLALQEASIETSQFGDYLMVQTKGDDLFLQLTPMQINDRAYCQQWSVYDPTLVEAGLPIKNTVSLVKLILNSHKKGKYRQPEKVLNDMCALLQENDIECSIERDFILVNSKVDDNVFMLTYIVTKRSDVKWMVHGLHINDEVNEHSNLTDIETAKLMRHIITEKLALQNEILL